jgi:hypothetical protein
MALDQPYFFKPKILKCVEEIKQHYPRLDIKIQVRKNHIYIIGSIDSLTFKEIGLIVKRYFPDHIIHYQKGG